MPEVKWRLTSSFPKSLDTLWGASETFAKYVSEATDSKFQIQPFAAGEIVPALQALDAVSNGTVEMCHTAAYYYVGKDPTFPLFCAVPFGLNTRQQNAWFYDGGAQKLMDEFTKKFNVVSLLGGNTGAQMGGWFRKEIKDVADLNGLKMRIARLRRPACMQKLGVVPQQIAGGEIYPALEKGTIDAAEWVGPYDDEKLGFHKVAPYLLLPGLVGRRHHAALHVQHRASGKSCRRTTRRSCTAAAGAANIEETARYDARNPQALKRLVAAGAQLRPFTPADHGGLPEGRERGLCRHLGDQCRLQEGLRQHGGLPERRVSVVAGGRIHLRHLHDPDAPARLTGHERKPNCRTRGREPRVFSFGIGQLFRKIAASRLRRRLA